MAAKDRPFAGSIFRSDTTNARAIFDRIVYDKGAWVLHMLRHIVGDDIFFDILYNFAQKPELRYGNITTSDFQQICEQKFGTEMDWFFEPWIYGTGRPVYAYNWTLDPKGDLYEVTLDIEQQQLRDHPLFPMPVDILLQNISRDTVITVFNENISDQFRFEVDFEPLWLFLDNENWILKYVQNNVGGLPDNQPEQVQLLQNYPNPFNAETTITLLIKTAMNGELRIFNNLGEQVRLVESGQFPTGVHKYTWDGTDDTGNPVGSGLYFCEFKGQRYRTQQKMLLLR
jgi:hypothetical protein